MKKRLKLVVSNKKSEKKKRPGRPEKYTPIEIIDSLKKNDGLLTRVAKDLNGSYYTICNYVNRYLEVKEVYLDYKKKYDDKLITLAKEGLEFHLKKKNLGAICFVLKTKAKCDGWSEKAEIEKLEQEIKLEKQRRQIGLL